MKKRNLVVMLLAVAFLAGCGNVTEDVIAESTEIVESTEDTEIVESTQMDTSQTESVEIEEKGSSEDIESDTDESEGTTYTEQGNLYLLEDVQHHPENNIDINTLEVDGSKYKLVNSVNIYHTDKTLAGCTKENFLVCVVASNDEWSYCNLGAETENYLVKTAELMEAISEQDKRMLLAASATPTPAPTEEPKTETQPTTNIPASSESVADVPVESTPASEPPVAEQPAAEESDKYTPEEAIAVWKAIIDESGMIYDPSIKEFASWGTGFMYLDKGYPEQAAQWDLEGLAYGDGTGNSTTRYYFEVTGSDENCVYTIVWGCN